jgi:hypothetical protein
MTGPVDPVRRVARSSRVDRGAASVAPSEAASETANLPVPVGPARTHAPERPAGADAAFAAQLIGGAPRRGLKGGPGAIEQAHSAYLGTEYSGAADRRAKSGRSTKTDV